MRSCFRTFNKKVGKDILSIELENTIYKIIKEFELRFFSRYSSRLKNVRVRSAPLRPFL